MTYIKWDDDNNVGVKIIDDQHKHFVGLLNHLYSCLEAKDVKRLPNIINDVVEYANYHFETEEKYLIKFNYADADSHIAAHNNLRLKINDFANKSSDSIESGFDFLYFMEHWFLIHFKGSDAKFAKLFNQNGLE
jgi:hemerythrin